MIKILHVVGRMDLGGIENLLMGLLEISDNKNFQFDFVQHGQEEAFYNMRIRSQGCRILKCPKYTIINHYFYARWWDHFFRTNRDIDIVHSHIRSTASIILHIAQKHGLKTISHAHGMYSGGGISGFIKKRLQNRIIHSADQMLACSEDAGQWLFGEQATRLKNFQVVNNYVDLQKFQYSELQRNQIRKQYSIEPDDIVLGHVGNFRREKNHVFMLDILSELKRLHPEEKWRLLFVGEGSKQKKISRMTQKKNLNDSVIFAGSSMLIPELLSAMDIFLLPSLFEGFGIAGLEAQATGLHTILSPRLPKEIAVSSLAHQMENFEISAWIDEILKIIPYINLREDISQEIVEKGFDFESVKEQYQSIYRKVAL